jgi:predicted DNA-binding transcriptional regulator AlpA
MITPPLPAELEQFRAIDERTVAPILGVSLSTLRNWRVTGRGPEYIKVNGRAVRYSLASTLAWRDQQTVRPRR